MENQEINIWRNHSFSKLWAGVSVSLIGTEITLLAFPTIAIQLLHQDVLSVSLLRTAETLPLPILGIFAGAMADRLNNKKMMIIADLFRFLALAIFLAMALNHQVSYPLMVAVAICLGVFTTIYNAAFMAFIPKILKREEYIEGNAKISLSMSSAKLIGPSIAGFLIVLIGAAKVVIFDSFSYIFGALAVLWIPDPEQHLEKKAFRLSHIFREIGEGFGFVFKNPILLSLTLATAVLNLGMSSIQAILLVYAYQELKLSPNVMGIIFGIGSGGMVLATFIVSAIRKKLGIGKSLLISSLIISVSLCGLCIAQYLPAVPSLTVCWFLVCLALPIFDINQVTVRQTLTPIELQGRMNATVRTLVWGAIPLGAFLGGLISKELGIQAALLGGGLVVFIAVLMIWGTSLYKIFTVESLQIKSIEIEAIKVEA